MPAPSSQATPPRAPALSRAELVCLLGASLLSACLLAGLSGFSPWITPDTGGYLHPPAGAAAWARERHPLFGWLVGLLPGDDLRLVPPLQSAAFLLAAVGLHAALRRYGLSLRAAASVTASLLLSNLILIWNNAVHPEVLSAALAVASLALVVDLASGRGFATQAVLLTLAGGASYVLRPTFLPAVFLFPALYALLARRRGAPWIGRRAFALAALLALPFLLNSAWRWREVGDFNIVSFGGFQMSGMAGLMLDPEVMPRLPEDLRPLAESILAGRAAAERRGDVIATPPNATGARSFVSTALGYYDLYARAYDPLLYGVIKPLGDGVPWVEWNRRLMRFSLAVVRAEPLRYAAWLVGGTARALGHLVVINLPCIAALAAMAFLYPLALWRGRLGDARVAGPDDVPVLVCLSALYTLAAGILTVVTTFPAARYLDTAGLILPALPIYGALTLLAGLWRRQG